jgi:hypothetical protein
MRQFTINVLCMLALPVLGVLYTQEKTAALQAQQDEMARREQAAQEQAEQAAAKRREALARLAEKQKEIDAALEAMKSLGKAAHKPPTIEALDVDIPGVLGFGKLESMPRAIAKQGGADIPDDLKALDGKPVTISGFLLVAFAVEPVEEVILAKNPWDTCCLGKPPTLFDSVRVLLRKGSKLERLQFRIATFTGTLRVEPEYDGGVLTGLYRIENAVETDLAGVPSAAPQPTPAEAAAAERQNWYVLAMPLILVIAVVNNLIPGRRTPQAPAAADVTLSDKKFSLKD